MPFFAARPKLRVSADESRLSKNRMRLRVSLAAIVVSCLILPHFFSIRSKTLAFEPGYIVSGDEPHYLITIASFVEDGDVDLSNNYEAIHAGKSWSAGRYFFNDGRIDHHAHFLIDNKPVNWGASYQSFQDRIELQPEDRDAYGRFYPKPQPGGHLIPPGTPEYSLHQSGIAYLVAPLTFWARGTKYFESVALLGSALATTIAFFFFRKMLAYFTAERRTIDMVSLVTFLGTSVWFYSRSLFLESFLLMCVSGAYSLVIWRQLPLLAGCFVACALQLKAYYLLAMLPLGADILLRKDWKYLIWFALPIVGSGILFLVENKMFYGSYLTGPQAFIFGPFWEGARGLIFSWEFGLFYSSPVVIVPFLCWPTFLRRFPREAILLGSAFLINYLLMANYFCWWGGHCYGPRYLTPLIPFLFVALACRPEWATWRSLKGLTFWSLATVSIACNAVAVFYYERFWASLPLIRIYGLCRYEYPKHLMALLRSWGLI